jgi:stringent starvation protein B
MTDTPRTDTAREKRETMETIMEQGIAMIHLDPRREEVQVPARFRTDPVLRLNYAWGFKLPALTIDDEGVYAILNFQGQRAAVNVPWSAIFAVTAPEREHEGRVWPEDVPKEMVAAVQAQAKARLREVEVSEESGEATRPDRPSASKPDGDRPPSRGHLRVVK